MLVGVVFVAICVLFQSASVQCGNNTITDEVFFDVKVTTPKNESWQGRFVVGVFGDVLPMTTFNFINLAKGYKHRDEKWKYEGTKVHRIVHDFLIQTGDVIFQDGSSGRSVFAPYFIDENFIHSHRAAGYVAMANTGEDTNNSQFYITLTRARWLDNRNVVFGKIIKGMDVVKRIGELEVDEEQFPKDDVEIVKCGVLPLVEHYELTDADLDTSGDVKPGPKAPNE